MRRPHAYWFLQDLFEKSGGIRSATPEGVTLGDGVTAPLPGIYFLDAEGRLLESVALASGDAREDLLAAITRVAGR